MDHGTWSSLAGTVEYGGGTTGGFDGAAHGLGWVTEVMTGGLTATSISDWEPRNCGHTKREVSDRRPMKCIGKPWSECSMVVAQQLGESLPGTRRCPGEQFFSLVHRD